MTSLLRVDTLSGPSKQCHISYQWPYTWIAPLQDTHKASPTRHMDREPSLQHFCQVTATLIFPAAWFCLFNCSCNERLAVLSCIPFYLLGKRLIPGQRFHGLTSQLKQILSLKIGISFRFSPFLNSQFLEVTENCLPLKPLLPHQMRLPLYNILQLYKMWPEPEL